MKQLEGLKADEIEGFVQENLDKSSVVTHNPPKSLTIFYNLLKFY